MGFIDTGATYTPVQLQDPGPDNKLGTADDGQFITVYNKSGDTFYEMTNPRRRDTHVQRVPGQRQEALLAQLADQYVVHLVTNARQREQQLRCKRGRQQFDAATPVRAAFLRIRTARSTATARSSSTIRITSRPRAPTAYLSGVGSTSAASTATSPEPRGAAGRA